MDVENHVEKYGQKEIYLHASGHMYKLLISMDNKKIV